MILKASERGNPSALGRHLLNERDNEIVQVHEVSGFLNRDVSGAMRELETIARGCKSKKPLFSVSLSPPIGADAGIGVYEHAIRQIEEANGLTGQPRIIVFHEKEARRHCHCAWSRIDAETMTVKPLPFYKNKLNQVAKGIYLQQGWELPPGFVDKRQRDPRSFDLAEWQQCKRIGRDPAQLKMLAQESWSISGNGKAFARALEQRGLYLAKGDKRGHVAMTIEGEVFSIPKLLDKRTKEVRERLGDIENLRSVEETHAHIAGIVLPKLKSFIDKADTERAGALAPLDQKRAAMAAQHKTERALTDAGIRARANAENALRASRMRSGLVGLWDRLRGEYQRLRDQNEREAWAGLERDRQQRENLMSAQMRDRAELQREIVAVRHAHTAKMLELHRDLDRQREIHVTAPVKSQAQSLRDTFMDAHKMRSPEVQSHAPNRAPERRTERERDFGLDL